MFDCYLRVGLLFIFLLVGSTWVCNARQLEAPDLSEIHEDSCGMCHRAVSEVLIKLKDPDTQLEIIELLLKECKSMQNYATKCKKMVFEYGPLILVNAEHFLETTDVCTVLHACKPGTGKASEVVNVNSLADS